MLQDRIFFFIWDLLFRNLGFQSKVDPTPCFEQLKRNTIQVTFLETHEVDRLNLQILFAAKHSKPYILRLHYIRKPVISKYFNSYHIYVLQGKNNAHFYENISATAFID